MGFSYCHHENYTSCQITFLLKLFDCKNQCLEHTRQSLYLTLLHTEHRTAKKLSSECNRVILKKKNQHSQGDLSAFGQEGDAYVKHVIYPNKNMCISDKSAIHSCKLNRSPVIPKIHGLSATLNVS